jgi:glycosyltransferase involved in cell wall biosynthesis
MKPLQSVCRGSETPGQKLVYLTDSLSRAGGGLFDAVRILAKTIGEHGRYSPAVLGLYEPDYEVDRPAWGSIEARTFKVVGPRAFGYAPALLEYIKAKDPDLVHVHGLWMYPSVAAIQWSRGSKPYVVSPHGMLDPWALNNSRWKKRISAALYEARHLRGASCLHALNDTEARAIRSYGLTNPICVIPNGVELPDETKLNSAPKSRVLLFLGRIHPKKNLVALIEAWTLVQSIAEKAGWRLRIAGWDQNGHRSELEVLTRKLRANSSIDIAGPQFGEDKEYCYRTASAFILPSFSEGMPMSVLEAWSWRLPVVMTSNCNLSLGVDAGAAIVTGASVDGISSALRQLLSMNSTELSAMGANGRRLVQKRFQWPCVVQQMTQVYDWLVGLKPQPACIVT